MRLPKKERGVSSAVRSLHGKKAGVISWIGCGALRSAQTTLTVNLTSAKTQMMLLTQDKEARR